MVKCILKIAAISLCLSACGEARDVPDQNLSETIYTHESETLEFTVKIELVDSELGLLVGMVKDDADKLLEAAGLTDPILAQENIEGACEDRSQLYIRSKKVSKSDTEWVHVHFSFEQVGEDCVPVLAQTINLKS
ncbi:MAG: hypothetical protein WBF53_14015 [Litorimonas sp.]